MASFERWTHLVALRSWVTHSKTKEVWNKSEAFAWWRRKWRKYDRLVCRIICLSENINKDQCWLISPVLRRLDNHMPVEFFVGQLCQVCADNSDKFSEPMPSKSPRKHISLLQHHVSRVRRYGLPSPRPCWEKILDCRDGANVVSPFDGPSTGRAHYVWP